MKNAHVPHGDLVAHEVDVDLDVLRALMVDRVGGHVDCDNIAAVDDCHYREGNVEFLEELLKPTTLGHGMVDGAVLSLYTGARSARLWSGIWMTSTPGCWQSRCTSLMWSI
jgi:hypothetical protein